MGYVYIVNVDGSSNDKSYKEYGDYESWIDYWYNNSLYNIPTYCPIRLCNKKIYTNNKIVGAHVYTCTLKEKNKENERYTVHTDKIYIVPICNFCNINKKGYDTHISGSQEIDVMQIDEKYLVLHPRYI